MVKGLSKEIREALNRYYRNRNNQTVLEWSDGKLRQRGWNRGQDLNLIIDAAQSDGWSVHEFSGHFWFMKPLKLRGQHIIEVVESTLPDGGTSNIRVDDESLFPKWIANAIERRGRNLKPDEEVHGDAYADPKGGS